MDSLKQHQRLIIIILLLLSLCFAASGRGGFRGLVMMLIPLFFAVDNVLRQKQLPGSWTIRWGKFWTALALQVFILGGPLYALFLLERADAYA